MNCTSEIPISELSFGYLPVEVFRPRSLYATLKFPRNDIYINGHYKITSQVAVNGEITRYLNRPLQVDDVVGLRVIFKIPPEQITYPNIPIKIRSLSASIPNKTIPPYKKMWGDSTKNGEMDVIDWSYGRGMPTLMMTEV
jgi:hypothetical protein